MGKPRHSGKQSSSLIDVFFRRILREPEKIAYTYLVDGETTEISITYQELDRNARVVASHLQCLGMEGERVLLLYPPGLEFISAFLGCLYIGSVAIPAYPPRLNQTLTALQSIVADSQAKAALTTTSLRSRLNTTFVEASSLRSLLWIATDE